MEQWRSIRGYEGLYEVSSTGKVRRVRHWKRQETSRSSRSYRYKQLREMELRPSTSGRYARVSLCNGKVVKNASVHRLVAEAFIPNPGRLPEVNHKDCDRMNNAVENLEWCNRKYNVNYGDRTAKAMAAIEKKVLCVETGIIYNSGTKAAVANGVHKSKISLVCNGKRQTAGGYHWKFVEVERQRQK